MGASTVLGAQSILGQSLGQQQYIGDAYNQLAQFQANQCQGLLQAAAAQQTARTAPTPVKKVTMFGSMKRYFEEHRDLLMTVGILIVIDQWVFDGAFKEKIKTLVDRMVGHAEGKMKALEAKK